MIGWCWCQRLTAHLRPSGAPSLLTTDYRLMTPHPITKSLLKLRQLRRGKALALAMTLFAMACPPVAATQAHGSFDVLISLQAGVLAPQTGLCTTDQAPGAFGATVTVVCKTGTVTGISAIARGLPYRPVHGGAYRFLIQSDAVASSDNINYSGSTSTSMRVIRGIDWQYIEMTVGW